MINFNTNRPGTEPFEFDQSLKNLKPGAGEIVQLLRKSADFSPGFHPQHLAIK